VGSRANGAEFDHTLRMLDEFRSTWSTWRCIRPTWHRRGNRDEDDVPAKKSADGCTKSRHFKNRLLRPSTPVISTARSTCWWKARPKVAGTAHSDHKVVHFASDAPLAGALVDVEITSTEPWFLQGRVVSV